MHDDSSHPPVSAEALTRRHESRNPTLRWVLVTAGVVALMVVVSLGVVWTLMDWLSQSRPSGDIANRLGIITAPSEAPLRRFPAPQLQLIPHEELVALQIREQRELSTYGWLDRTAGVIRIPIEQAMELVAQRGLPTRATNGSPRADRSTLDLIRERSQQR
jgi:hypothetical protein